MSWLFCCGKSDAEKDKEKRQTIDLSRPLMQMQSFTSSLAQDGLDGLSGEKSPQSTLLDSLINKLHFGSMRKESMLQTTEDGSSSKVCSVTTDDRRDNSKNHRLATEIRLNHFLMQA